MSSINMQSLFQTASQIVSDIHIANEEKKRDIHLFNKSFKIDKDIFNEIIKITKQCYLIDSLKELKQHAQQLDADYIYNLKESERDMFDQKNQQYQTVIVSASVMFSALSTVIIQGIIPTNSHYFIFIAYSITTSLSFGSLFLSLVICIEIISDASKFMFYKSKKLSENLRNNDSKQHKEGKEFKKLEENLKNIVNIEDNDILTEIWQNHEKYIDFKLNRRDKINNYLSLKNLDVGNNEFSRKRHYYNNQSNDNNNELKLFSDYFDQNLKGWGHVGLRLFYGGTYNLLLSIIIFMFSKFYLSYDSVAGASISVGLIGSFIIFVILLTENKGEIEKLCCISNNGTSSSKKYKTRKENRIIAISFIYIAISASITISAIVLLGQTRSPQTT